MLPVHDNRSMKNSFSSATNKHQTFASLAGVPPAAITPAMTHQPAALTPTSRLCEISSHFWCGCCLGGGAGPFTNGRRLERLCWSCSCLLFCSSTSSSSSSSSTFNISSTCSTTTERASTNPCSRSNPKARCEYLVYLIVSSIPLTLTLGF